MSKKKKEIHGLDIAHNQFFVPHNVFEEEKFISMPLSAQMLYVHLCRLKNRLRGNGFYRSIRTLAKDTGMNYNTVLNAKKLLVKNLYVDVDRDYFTHNGFRSADRFSLNGYKYKDQKIQDTKK